MDPEHEARRMSDRVARTWVRKIGVTVVALLLIEYLAVPQIVEASSHLTLFEDAAPLLLVLALALQACSLAVYTALTRAVLPRGVRPRFVDQFRIDLTGFGASHVLPGGGASAAALRFRLMTLRGIPADEAACTAAAEAAMAGIGLVAIFAGGVVLAGPGVADHPGYAAAGAASAAALVGAWLVMRAISRRPRAGRGTVARQPVPSFRLPFLGHRTSAAAGRLVGTGLDAVRTTVGRADTLVRDPRRRVVVLGWAAGNWLLDAACLWACLRAYGVGLQPGALLTAYGAANLIGLLPVTPGGLGVVEGVLIPALTALGETAVAPVTLGVLTWRLLQFWLPIPVSGLTYLSLKMQRKPPDPPSRPDPPEHREPRPGSTRPGPATR